MTGGSEVQAGELIQKIEMKLEDCRARRPQNTNINHLTQLVTDYLNYLNEAIVLIEMVAALTDMIDEVLEWEPKSYS
ncbi:MAG: hypothetical protein CMM16_06340 [Rhodospirillaceae bacterium]|nr:hypothetical protein [Rhodospirillaceae bacterium]|tara:strand:- start:331 stop:561 length:231 start_codon:yes stop_codon:yes gene_type:complete